MICRATQSANTLFLPLSLSYLLLVACGGSAPDEPGDAQAPEAINARQLPTDAEIIAKVYDTTFSVPEGFFVDERANTQRSYSLYHVKDASISYEICTDDYDEAYELEAADNELRAVNGYYVGAIENNKYFEFIRELSYPDGVGNVADLTSPGFSRVFKCSSINRDGVDRNLRNGYAGTLNERPLSVDSIRIFTEYMWQFTFFPNTQKKVLQSFSTEKNDAYEHTLLLAFAINQGFGNCDRIEVVDWVFTADKMSGEITKDFIFLFAFNAQINNGIPEKC